MRLKKKKWIPVFSMMLTVVLLVTAVLLCPASAEAVARFPGVDLLINKNSSKTPFTVLEVVEHKDEAAIGFYFEGNEPFGFDENGEAVSFEKMLRSFHSSEERKAYVEEIELRLNGMYSMDAAEKDSYPLYYREYQETYFPEDVTAGWNEVKLSKYQMVSLKGAYVPAKEGEVADYVLNRSSYVIAEDGKGNYAENIAGFRYAGKEAAYHVTFTEDAGSPYAGLGVYQKQYEEVLTVNQEEELPQSGIYYLLTADNSYIEVSMENCIFGTEGAGAEGKTLITEGTVLYRDYYVYAGETEDGALTESVYYIGGYQFAYDAATKTYTGEYASILKNGEEAYVEVLEGTGSHMKEEDSYSLLPGVGNYRFVPDENGEECKVEVDSYYYQGGFENNSWFSEKIFELEEGEIDLNVMSVKIKTVTVDQLNTNSFSDVNLIVLGGMVDGIGYANMTAPQALALKAAVRDSKVSCMIHSDIMKRISVDSPLYTAMQGYYTPQDGNPDEDGQFVNGCVYWYTGELVNKELGTRFTEEQSKGFEEILAYIAQENENLKKENENIKAEELISTELSQAKAIQYVLSRQSTRDVTRKQSLTVLEIEPCNDYFFINEGEDNSEFDKIRALTGYSAEEMPDEKITIVQMTTAEFSGNIDDLNGLYDFIYIGMQTGLMNMDKGETVYNDSAMNGLVYTHTGDAVIAHERLIGLLDTDYVENNRAERYPYGRDVYKIRTSMIDGKLQTNWQTITFDVDKKVGSGHYDEQLTLGNVGVYRYSGNDITTEKRDDLLEYIQAGYPVVLADGFFEYDESANRVINEKRVDNSSYLYEFVKAVFEKDNLFRYGDIVSTNPDKQTQEDFGFYMSTPKLTIQLNVDGGSIPPIINWNRRLPQYIRRSEDGCFYLSYTFAIEDDAMASSEDTRYSTDIYLDSNANSRFSRENELMSDLIIIEAETEKVVAQNDLRQGVVYTVKGQVPETFDGVLSWKFEIRETENPLIRQSIKGYSKLYVQESKEEIKILQICNADRFNNWVMNEDSSFTALFEQVENFDITIESIEAAEYEAQADPGGFLQGYDVVIVGFEDSFGNLENPNYNAGIEDPKAIEGIQDYIISGKSIVFTHDNMSFVNTDRNSYDLKDAGIEDIENLEAQRWGYALTAGLRDYLGMDRYGVTSGNGSSTILKAGQILNAGTAEYKTVADAGRDMAYVAGSNRTQTYPEVQGFTYSILNSCALDITKDTGIGSHTTYYNLKTDSGVTSMGANGCGEVTNPKITKMNDGQISSYPFKIDDRIEYTQTHAQYYQLDLEKDKDQDGQSDLVVWYCISDGDGTNPYAASPNDARNNYYIYSVGNVFYSGVGHDGAISESEKKLFINTVVAAYYASASEPEISVVDREDIYAEAMENIYLPAEYSITQTAESFLSDGPLQFCYHISATKEINQIEGMRVQYYLASEAGEPVEHLVKGETVNAIDITSEIKTTSGGVLVNPENMKNGTAYTAQWIPKNPTVYEMLKDRDKVKIYLKVSYSTEYNGVETTKYGSDYLYIKKLNLFHLD